MAIQEAQWAATRTQRPEPIPAGDGTPTSYHIWTIGCQMNKADSDRLASALEQLGLKPAPTAQLADVVVFNSCVVRQSAEDKVVGALGMAKSLKRQRPERIVALMGCMVGPKKDDAGGTIRPRRRLHAAAAVRASVGDLSAIGSASTTRAASARSRTFTRT